MSIASTSSDSLPASANDCLRLGCLNGEEREALRLLLASFDLTIDEVDGRAIPGSYWGDSEAGLIDSCLYVREDTPVHSLLHEACHYICMSPARRINLDTNAEGDYDEENAVCFLQIRLASQLPFLGVNRMCADMDAWGYTFRLGSAARWYADDARDALEWLIQAEVLLPDGKVSGKLRMTPDAAI